MYIDYVKTVPEALKIFENNLKEYILSLRGICRGFQSAHADMSNFWQDSQYRNVRQTIERAISDIEAELSRLEVLSVIVNKKLQILLKTL